jgi:hypothetical protein
MRSEVCLLTGRGESSHPDADVSPLNHFDDAKQILTRRSVTDTSISTPTTVASDAPDERPNNIHAVAIATSKELAPN